MGNDLSSVVFYPKGFKFPSGWEAHSTYTVWDIATLRISDFTLGPRALTKGGDSPKEDFEVWMKLLLT